MTPVQLLARALWFFTSQAVVMAATSAVFGDVAIEATRSDGTRVFRVQTDIPLTFVKDGITYRLSFDAAPPPSPDDPDTPPPPPPDTLSETVRQLTSAVNHPARPQTARDLVTVYGSLPQLLDALGVTTLAEARQFEEAGFSLVVTSHSAASAWSGWWSGVSARLSPLSFAAYKAAMAQVAQGLTAGGAAAAGAPLIVLDAQVARLDELIEKHARWVEYYSKHPDKLPPEPDLPTVRKRLALLERQRSVVQILRGEFE